MSGICAIFNLDGAPVDPKSLHKMAAAAAYRGTDGINFWHEGSYGVVHLALHTTADPGVETQPLITSDGLVLVADARIDNRDELVGVLARQNPTINLQAADTELIMAAYRFWGEDCPKHLIGDYVFILYNRRTKTLFCGRDALGCKPLFYAVIGKKLILASEAAQILEFPEVPRDLDEITIGNFLLGNWSEPERTMFTTIKALLPAHTLSVDRHSFTLNRFWKIDPSFEIRYYKEQDYADHFFELLRQSINDRLRVPNDRVGILLSGGLDSTSIASIIQKQINHGSHLPALDPISYYYEKAPNSDEREYSKVMESDLGLKIDYVNGDEFWLLKDREDFKPRADLPLIGAEGLYRHLLTRLRERGNKVYFTGHGGDHFSQGTPQVYTDRFRGGDFSVFFDLKEHARLWHVSYTRLIYQYLVRPFIPDAARNSYRKLRGKVDPPEIPRWINPEFIKKHDLIRRETNRLTTSEFKPKSRAQMALALDSVTPLTTHQDHLAAKNQLEPRYPFFDRRLVEFAMAIPPGLSYQGGTNKALLRRALAGTLPEAIRTRRSKTLGDPFIHYSLREKEPYQVSDLLKRPILCIMGIVKLEELQLALTRYLTKPEQNNPAFEWVGTNPWNLISLELWFQWYYNS